MDVSNSFYPQSIYTWTVRHFGVESEEKIKEISKTSLLYSIVRHPYERLNLLKYVYRFLSPNFIPLR